MTPPYNYLYEESKANIYPVTGEPIQVDSRLPENEALFGFIYRVYSINPDTVVFIPDVIMTNPSLKQALVRNANAFKVDLAACKDRIYWTHLLNIDWGL